MEQQRRKDAGVRKSRPSAVKVGEDGSASSAAQALDRVHLFAMKLFLNSASLSSVHGHLATAASVIIQNTKLRALLRLYGLDVQRCCRPSLYEWSFCSNTSNLRMKRDVISKS